jgi:hypothetical protein
MRYLITGLLLGLGSACIPGNSPIRIEGATDVTDKCLPGSDMILHGTLDISGPGTYIVGFQVHSEIAAPSQPNTNMTELDTPGAHNFVADVFSVSYKATDPVITFVGESVPIFGVVTPGQTTNIFGNIMGQKAIEALRMRVTDPNADPKTTLSVAVQIKGHLQSGESITSDAITYPITVFTSGQNCVNGFVAAGPCSAGGAGGSPGQDGFAVVCK